MPTTLIPSYTKTKANKLSKLGISQLLSPSPIKIFWMNSFASGDKTSLISKKMHLHTFFEAHFILKGQNSYATDSKKSISLSRKYAVVFAPSQKHIVTEVGSGLVRVSLTFLPEKDSELYAILSQNAGIPFEMPDELCSNIDAIFAEIPIKSNISEAIVKNCMSNIILHCAKQLCRSDEENGYTDNIENAEIRVAMAKQYINDNKNRFLTCRDVAEQCHFNEKYLGRLFKNSTGKTLLEYIHAEKMKDAEKLLSDRSLSLKTVSETLGFANEYYFNTFFRRKSGITPGQFRNFTDKNNA